MHQPFKPAKNPKDKTPTEQMAKQVKKLLPKLKELGLQPKQISFICEYATNGFNATQAYVKAGYKKTVEEAVPSSVHGVSMNPKVRQGLKLFIECLLEGAQINLSKQLIDTWFMQAFYDPSWFINPDGELTFSSWDEIPAERRICVEGIETKYYGKDAMQKVTVCKLVDRKWSQDKLDKYIQLTRDTKVLELSEIPADRKKNLGNIFQGIEE